MVFVLSILNFFLYFDHANSFFLNKMKNLDSYSYWIIDIKFIECINLTNKIREKLNNKNILHMRN